MYRCINGYIFGRKKMFLINLFSKWNFKKNYIACLLFVTTWCCFTRIKINVLIVFKATFSKYIFFITWLQMTSKGLLCIQKKIYIYYLGIKWKTKLQMGKVSKCVSSYNKVFHVLQYYNFIITQKFIFIQNDSRRIIIFSFVCFLYDVIVCTEDIYLSICLFFFLDIHNKKYWICEIFRFPILMNLHILECSEYILQFLVRCLLVCLSVYYTILLLLHLRN